MGEDEAEIRAFLDAMSDEEQLKYAKFQFACFMSLLGRKTDYYGYEGCSCFMPCEDGRYMILAELNEEREFLNDTINIENAGDAKDQMMAELKTHTLSDNESAAVEYIHLERADEQGKKHKLYVGYVPVVYDGEIKAVITLNYNYDLFVEKTDNMLLIALAVIIAVNLLVCALFILRTRRIATKPIESIQGAVRDYMTTKNSGNARDELNQIHSDNEICALADDVGEMIVTIDDHIGEITAAGNRHKALTKDVMEALASAIDAKDKYTNGHSKRVAEYSRKIAELAGKSSEECEMIYDAGLLHDVGKIGVPLEILQKKSRLTDEEFEQIKVHPVTGGEILSQIHECLWLKTGALYHHERYNGRGYPEGRKGEEIPEIARIIAVADAYDAMTSNRSYRNAIPQHIVREEFVKGSGTQFDPDFARIMIHLIDLDIEYSMQESISGENFENNDRFRCDSVYHDCSDGVNITRDMAKIRFCCQPDDGFAAEECLPTLIIFDSLDGQVHPGEENNKDLMYYEFAKIRLDGKLTPLGVRKSEIRVIDGQTDIERAYFGEPVRGQRYQIKTVRNRDHLLVHVSTETQMFDVILALPDPARYTFIAVSGEHCEIHNLRADTGVTFRALLTRSATRKAVL